MGIVAQQLQLRSYTLEDGLPQSEVTDIVQDTRGYLWLGTQGGGLCRFDGDRFEVWRPKDGLLSSYIQTLSTTPDTLFVGTRRGLSIKVGKHFVNYKGHQINAIYCFRGKRYLATNSGIASYTKTKGVTSVPIHPQIDASRVNAMLFDGKYYWIATGTGLWKLSGLEDTAQGIEQYDTNDFRALVSVQNKVFAAAYGDGILVIDPDLGSQEALLIREPLRVNHLSIPRSGELWAATDNEGIVIIAINTYNEKKRWNSTDGLKAKTIKKVVTDRHSNIWIATAGDGFYKYFQNNFKHYNQDSGLKGNHCYALHADHNTIWTSSVSGTLTAIDSLGIHHVSGIADFSEVKFRTITSDANGNIWAGTDGRGILFRETKTAQEILRDSTFIDSISGYRVQTDTVVQKVIHQHVIDTARGLVSDWIRTLVVDNEWIWAATYADGITKFRYDSTQDRPTNIRVFGKNEGLKDLALLAMKKGPNGKLWYGTQHGELGYIAKDKVVHLGKVLEDEVAINTLLFHHGILYLGTAGKGVWWADLKKVPFFEKLEGKKSLPSDHIYQLLFDDQDQLWVGTELGVDQVLLDGSNAIEALFHFGKNEGFLGIETSPQAATRAQNGNLWFGTIRGLTTYESHEDVKTRAKPKIRFDEIQVNYTPLDSLDYQDWTNSNRVLQLRPEQTQMTFAYCTVDIDHPTGIQYRFQLDDGAWSPWSVEKKQNLPALHYGKHIFRAQSRNFRWEQSNTISFQFFIATPWYEKSWVPWLGAGIITFGFALLVLRYIGRIKKRNAAARERLKMENNLLSLEHKALRLQMNPHFIFNVLHGIKAMGSSNPQKMNTTINSFATLLRETLYNSRKDEITLDQEIKTLKNYIEIEQLMTSKTFSYEITTDLDLDPEDLLIPPMLIQPFVENAIRHGILKGTREGVLRIQFYTKGTFLYGKVIDNGIGIFESQKTKRKTDHQSLALMVTQERLVSISGKDALKISELKDEEGQANGTEICFKIPVLTDF